MTRRARFKVNERCDGAPSCTVLVETASTTYAVKELATRALISVRPKGRRRLYTLPLATVAEMIVAKVVKAELTTNVLQQINPARRRRLG